MKLQVNGIYTAEDWFRISPPMGGKKQWRDGRSAKELARYITSAYPDVPMEIESVLSNLVSPDSAFAWAAEYVTDLTAHNLGQGEGRNHDVMMVNHEIFIGIEGKADESFGSQYVGTALGDAGRNKKHRINGMIKMLYGDAPEKHADIRYQLVTAACATLLEAKMRGLHKAMLMVIVFKKPGCYSDKKIADNKKDMKLFLSHSNAIENTGCWTVPTVYGRENNIVLYFSEITIELQ